MRVFPCCVRGPSLHLVEPSLHLVGVCVWDAEDGLPRMQTLDPLEMTPIRFVTSPFVMMFITISARDKRQKGQVRTSYSQGCACLQIDLRVQRTKM